MKIELRDFEQKHMAIDLRQIDDVLKWSSFGHTHTLIVRRKYGASFTLDKTVAQELSNIPDSELLMGKVKKLSNNSYVTLIKQSFTESYAISAAPASYAVYCCEIDRNSKTCVIYIPNEYCNYYCNVKYQVKPVIKPVEQEQEPSWLERLFPFLYSPKPTLPYFSLYIPVIPGYENKGLYYTFKDSENGENKFEYPITKKMLGRGIIILSPDDNGPIVVAESDSGYTVEIT